MIELTFLTFESHILLTNFSIIYFSYGMTLSL